MPRSTPSLSSLPAMTAAPKPRCGHALLWALIGVAGLAGCGGGSGSEAAKPQSTSIDAATAAAGGASGAIASADTPASAASAALAASAATAEAEPTVKAAAAVNKADTAAPPKAAPTPAPTPTPAPATATASVSNPAKTGTVTAPSPAPAPAVINVQAPAPAANVSAGASPAPAATATAPTPAATPAPTAITYSAPITITKGGTYTGNWESTNPDMPAIVINTIEPVVIQNCNIRSVGRGIQSAYSNTQITVRNCKAQLLMPKIAGKSAGHFIVFYQPKSMIVENNEITGGLGTYADGGGKGADLIRIRYNKQTNVDGRQSDGKGGYAATFNIGQFAQLSKIQGIKDGEISWNQVVNQPGKSRVEDNINLFLTRGLPTRKFPVHNNFVQGGYPADPTKDGYSGGGIIVDGGSDSAATASGYLTIYSNQVVSTTNYGIAISAGINSDITNNRVIATGLLPTGEKIAAANVGLYIWDINNNVPTNSFSGNIATGNEIYWINKTLARNDAWFPNCAPKGCDVNQYIAASATTVLARGVTLLNALGGTPSATSVEDVEFTKWQAKVTAAAVKLGAQ